MAFPWKKSTGSPQLMTFRVLTNVTYDVYKLAPFQHADMGFDFPTVDAACSW